MKNSTPSTLHTNNSRFSKPLARALEVLSTIPKLVVKGVRPKSGDRGIEPNDELLLGYGNKTFKVAVELKSSGEPSVLRRSAIYLKDFIAKTKQDYAVIIAPFITRDGAAVCRDLGVGYVDLSGNCLVSLEALYVERTGYPNRFKEPREVVSLFSPKSSRVARCLLSNPERAWGLKGLATETGVSIGLIHRIATSLDNNLFARKEFRSFKLEDPARLLEAWREEYYRRPPRWGRYIAMVNSLEELLSNMKTSADHHGVRYSLTGPAGASLILSYMTPTVVHLYVDDLKNEFLVDLKADPVPSEGNLLIRVAEKENELIGSREVQGVRVVSDLQLYLNLWAMGGRGQEAAEELRRICFRF